MVGYSPWFWLLAACFLLFSPDVYAESEQEPWTIKKPSSGVRVGAHHPQFGLSISARVQARYVLENKGDELLHEFQIRRLRVKLNGHVFGKDNRFYIQLGMSPHDMTGGLLSEEGSPRRVPVRDARIEFHQLDWAQIWVGQMKVPFSRERLISDAYLDVIDRSLLNREFNMDRDIGVQIQATGLGGLFGYSVGVFSGQGRNTYDLSKVAASFVTRLQFHLFGAPDLKTQGDLQRSIRPGASLGAAYSYQSAAPGDQGIFGSRPTDGGTTRIEQATADLVFKWQGCAFEAATTFRRGMRQIDDLETVPDPARNGWGYLLQLGYLLPKTRLELVSSFSKVAPLFDKHTPTTLEPAAELSGTINYYLGGHDLKLQLDFTHHWQTSSSPQNESTLQTNAARLQVQMAI